MSQTNINIRIDKDTKTQAETLFAELGMNMTTAFNIFLKQVIRVGGIPFDITTGKNDGFYNPYNQTRLEKSMARSHFTKHDLIEDADD